MSENATKKLVTKLVFAVTGMFAFGFALVPLYDVFCEITGINGRTSNEAYQAVEVAVDESRSVRVQFVATNNAEMGWDFGPSQSSVTVHPGARNSVSYFARNPAGYAMVGQAIPSVTPGRAAPYVHKTECFCFERQPLQAGEAIDMPLQFIIDQDLPRDIRTITVSYTIFDVTDRQNVASAN